MEPLNVGGHSPSPMASVSQESPMDVIHRIALLYAYKEGNLSSMRKSKESIQGDCSSQSDGGSKPKSLEQHFFLLGY